MASSSKKRTAEAAAAANDEQGGIHFASLRVAIGNCRARTGAVFRLTICPAARVLARAEKPGRADLQELEKLEEQHWTLKWYRDHSFFASRNAVFRVDGRFIGELHDHIDLSALRDASVRLTIQLQSENEFSEEFAQLATASSMFVTAEGERPPVMPLQERRIRQCVTVLISQLQDQLDSYSNEFGLY